MSLPVPSLLERLPIPIAERRDAVAPGPLLTGILTATAATVRIDPGIIQGWLPRGVRFPDPHPDPHPLIVVWGCQHDVTAFPGGGRYALPWRLSYAEIITAVPDLHLDPESGLPFDGPMTYLPRLYMNSWRAALLGRAVYGFSKAFARIDASEHGFQATNRHGEELMSATALETPGTVAATDSFCGLFDQPVVLGTAGGLMVSRFETALATSPVRPVSADIDLRPALLSYLPAIRRRAKGIDQHPDGAYQFSTAWSLKRLS